MALTRYMIMILKTCRVALKDEDVCYAAPEIHQASQRPRKKKKKSSAPILLSALACRRPKQTKLIMVTIMVNNNLYNSSVCK